MMIYYLYDWKYYCIVFIRPTVLTVFDLFILIFNLSLMVVVCWCRPDMRYTTHEDVMPSNVTEFVLGGLKPATTFVVRLAAVNQAGRGPFSVTLLPVTTLPAGILVIIIIIIIIKVFRLTWNKVALQLSKVTWSVFGPGKEAQGTPEKLWLEPTPEQL